MKEPPPVLSTLSSIGLGVAAFGACLVVWWVRELHQQAARGHNRGCICRFHHVRRGVKVAGSGTKRRSA